MSKSEKRLAAGGGEENLPPEGGGETSVNTGLDPPLPRPTVHHSPVESPPRTGGSCVSAVESSSTVSALPERPVGAPISSETASLPACRAHTSSHAPTTPAGTSPSLLSCRSRKRTVWGSGFMMTERPSGFEWMTLGTNLGAEDVHSQCTSGSAIASDATADSSRCPSQESSPPPAASADRPLSPEDAPFNLATFLPKSSSASYAIASQTVHGVSSTKPVPLQAGHRSDHAGKPSGRGEEVTRGLVLDGGGEEYSSTIMANPRSSTTESVGDPESSSQSEHSCLPKGDDPQAAWPHSSFFFSVQSFAMWPFFLQMLQVASR